MMKNKLYSKLCCVVFLAWGIGLVGCNKTYTPPDIVGTWGMPEPYLRIVTNPDVYIEDYSLQQRMASKIDAATQKRSFWEEFQERLESYEDYDYPKTFSLNLNNTFSFTYVSNRILTGTYEQSGHIVIFSDLASPPNIIHGEADDLLLWLHLFNKTQGNRDPLHYDIMDLFDLDAEERGAYEVLIAGYQIGMGYKRTH